MNDRRIRRPEDTFGCAFELRKGQNHLDRARGEQLATKFLSVEARRRGIEIEQDRLTITETTEGDLTRVAYRYTPEVTP